MSKIAIIDGKSVFYRGYYAMRGLSLPDGTPTGAVYGFVSILLAVIEQLKPDNIYVAWDIKGTSTSKRSKLYPDYKAGRIKPPDDFYEQIPLLQKFLKVCDIPFLETDNYEADDIIATLASQAKACPECRAFLISSDLDMLQLLAPNVEMWALKTGLSKVEHYSPEAFEQKYGLKVEQFLDLKSLQGDTSDNIPGVPGVGPKTATELLQKYQTLENIFANLAEIESQKPSLFKKLSTGQDSAFLSKKLAQLFYDAPVKLDLNLGQVAKIDSAKVLDLFDELAFRSLKTRFKRLFGEAVNVAKDVQTSGNQLGLFGEENLEISDEPEPNLVVENVTEPNISKLESVINDQAVILEIISNKVYFAPINSEQFFSLDLKILPKIDLKKAKKIISFDHKANLAKLDQVYDFKVLPDLPFELSQIYDLNQAEFLLDPLTRRQDLLEVSETDLPRLKLMYQRQEAKFAEIKRLEKVASDIDFPLIPVLFLMEKRGVKIDKQTFKDLSQKLGKKLEELEGEIYTLAAQSFNLNSPLQLSQILFGVLGLPTQGIKKTKSGFSTGKDELDKLETQHEIIGKIKQYREISKIKSTYVDALPTQTDAQDILHTTFTQDVTSTGRLSSMSPNLQNIPVKSDLGQAVREGFVARPGRVFVSVDYAQNELRVASALADDKDLIAIFNSERDVHREMAAQIYGVAPDQVGDDQRRVAKTVNFSVLYGAGPRNLQQTTKLPYAEAKALIERYFTLRHKIKDFMQATLKQAEEQGFAETYFGRRRPTPDIKSSNFQVREAAKRASINMPIQGTAADLIKIAMVKLEQELLNIPEAYQILQIHDSILIEAKEGDEQKVLELASQVMTSVCPDLPVKFTVDAQIGKTWRGL